MQNDPCLPQNGDVPNLCSIIVVTLNEAQHLPKLKCALDALDRPNGVDVETILMDGGSTDGTPDLARRLGFTKVIVLPGASIPVCRNRGIAEAQGDWIAFLDGDCEPARDWLVVAATYLGNSAPRIVGWPVEPPTPRSWVQAAWHTHWLFKNPAATSGTPVRTDAFRLITTRNMLLTRQVLEKVGRFDEALTTGEDTDFVFRAQIQGADVVAVPSLRVIHHGEPATLAEFFRQQWWHANRSSYARIVRKTAGRTGGNVIWFVAGFVATAGIGVAGSFMALGQARPGWLALWIPFVFFLAGPAVVVASRAGRFRTAPALFVLYAAYGLARTLDLLGIGRTKKSWKTITGAGAGSDSGKTTDSDTPATP